MDDSGKYPEIVYKFRSWSDDNHRNVILKNQLFLSSPKDFNDPFDCRIPTNYHLLDTADKIKQYANEYTVRHFNRLTKAGINLEDHLKFLENRLANNIDEIQKESETRLYNDQDERYGVLSLSKIWDNILMWSHYSDFHKGYCVGFWEEKLRNSIMFGKGGPVIYNPNDDYPEINPLNEQDQITKFYNETHYKAKDWKYEDEYRLMYNFYHTIPTVSDRTVQISDDFFAEIILGLQMSKENKEEIKEIARSKNIPVYEAIKVPF